MRHSSQLIDVIIAFLMRPFHGLIFLLPIAFIIFSYTSLQAKEDMAHSQPKGVRGGRALMVSPPRFERALYRISWEKIIKVGQGSITLNREDACFTLRMSAKSTRFFDLFFKVRDYFVSRVIKDFSSFTYYEKRLQEGGYRRFDMVSYSPLKGEVHYSKNLHKMPPLYEPPPLFDPFSILFAYRFTCPKSGTCLLTATDGKHVDKVEVVAIGREEIHVPSGVYDTVKVQPKWKRMQGVFKKKKGGHVYVWVSTAPPHVPVKLEADIFIGKVVAELTSYSSSEDI